MAVVIFGSVPTSGVWRYRDLLQVFPMPPNARVSRVFAVVGVGWPRAPALGLMTITWVGA
jgi:hypothetical protein